MLMIPRKINIEMQRVRHVGQFGLVSNCCVLSEVFLTALARAMNSFMAVEEFKTRFYFVSPVHH
jgi:hypothetical protein